MAVLLRLAYLTVANIFAALRLLPMTDREKDAEILVLRYQVAVLERQLAGTRVRSTGLKGLPRGVLRRTRLLVRPDTVLRWHRDLICRSERCPLETQAARPSTDRPLHPASGSAFGAGEPGLELPAGAR